MRRMIGVLIALGLAAGVFALWPRSESATPSITGAAGTTATTTEPTPTSTTVEMTTTITTGPGSHVVETVEEAEAILRGLWFGWFEGIYNQDEDRIREVVVLDETVETALESFGEQFDREPRLQDLVFSNTQILKSNTECLAVWAIMNVSGFRDGSSGGVHVLRWVDNTWLRLSLWEFRQDLWSADCDSSVS